MFQCVTMSEIKSNGWRQLSIMSIKSNECVCVFGVCVCMHAIIACMCVYCLCACVMIYQYMFGLVVV